MSSIDGDVSIASLVSCWVPWLGSSDGGRSLGPANLETAKFVSIGKLQAGCSKVSGVDEFSSDSR